MNEKTGFSSRVLGSCLRTLYGCLANRVVPVVEVVDVDVHVAWMRYDYVDVDLDC